MIHHSCRFWRTFNGHMTPISYGVMSLGHFRAVLISTVFSGHGVIATVMPYKIDACVLPIGIKLVQIVVSSCQIGGASRAFATAKHVYVLGEICCYCICCQQCLHLILNHNLLLKSLTSCSIHLFCYNCHGIFMGFSWLKSRFLLAKCHAFFQPSSGSPDARWWVSAEMDEQTLHDVYLRPWVGRPAAMAGKFDGNPLWIWILKDFHGKIMEVNSGF